MIALLIIPVLLMIAFAGYIELRDMPSSKGRPLTSSPMRRTDYRETIDTGFPG